MVLKDEKRGTWYVRFRTKNNTGKNREVWKRGFSTKKAAVEWENRQKEILSGSTNMLFEDFCNEIFLPDAKLRRKESTYRNYEGIVVRDLIPYFGKYKLEEITTAIVREWQNSELVKTGRYKRPKSLIYLQNEHKMLSMIFHYAIKFYGLKNNPAEVVGNFRKTSMEKEMSFWTIEEYQAFSKAIKSEKPVLALAIAILFWCGLRRGEMLALTRKDFSFSTNELSVNKTKYRAKKGEFKLTSPKTLGSYRKVTMPSFLAEEIKEYMNGIPDLKDGDLIFPINETQLRSAIQKYSLKAGIKPIRIHDLRHSAVSLMIHLGYSAVAIGKRVGHSSQAITFKYAHLFPQVQKDIADKLDSLNQD